MLVIASNVLPIFILILIGWVIARTGLLKAETGDAISDFVFKIAVPFILFRTIAVADFHGASPFRLWAAYFSSALITMTLATFAARRIFNRPPRESVIAGISAVFSNAVFIGLPLIDRLLGPPGMVAMSILLAVHLPFMMMMGTILTERAAALEQGVAGRSTFDVVKQVGRNLLTNPLIIGIIAGVIVHFAGIPLIGPIKTVVDELAGIAGPTALIAIGMALTRYQISGNRMITAIMTLLKLMVLPTIVYAMATLVGLNQIWTTAIVLTASVPTGVNAWLFANQFKAGHTVAASTISLTTALGVLTVSFWAYLLS
ncbi:AEC family transporter [Rhizobium sp. PAMB 3182]